MKRIIVIGNCGAGKSRFAVELGRKFRLPVIHLDKLYWKEGWVRTPKDEWEKLQLRIIKEEKWIIDGNYKSTMEMRMNAAGTIIFLDFPKWLCMYRAIKRRLINRKIPRPDIPQELNERITANFVKWILTYPRKNVYKKLEGLKEKKRIIVMHNPKELARFLTDSILR
jgi:adenylate kinase family enzyme